MDKSSASTKTADTRESENLRPYLVERKEKKGSTFADSMAASFTSVGRSMGIFKGQRTNDARMDYRKRLVAYCKGIGGEMNVTQFSLQAQKKKRNEVITADSVQQLQLRSWGLRTLMPEFHRLASLRVQRIDILVDMANHALKVLQLRHDEATWILQKGDGQAVTDSINEGSPIKDNLSKRAPFSFFASPQPPQKTHESRLNSPQPPAVFLKTETAHEQSKLALQSASFFCPPEQLLAEDFSMSLKREELKKTDAEIQQALTKVKGLGPRLEPKPKALRRKILHQVLDKYVELDTARNQPLGVGAVVGKASTDTKSSLGGIRCSDGRDISEASFDAETAVRQELSDPFAAKNALRRRKIDDAFAEVVEDERTREGRLLKRWCDMTTANENNDKSDHSDTCSSGDGSGGDSSTSSDRQRVCNDNSIATNLLIPRYEAAHPRSVMAFINYFAEAILGDTFGISDVLSTRGRALSALSQTLIFRRVSRMIFSSIDELLDRGAGAGSGTVNAAAVTISSSIAGSGDLSLSAKHGARRGCRLLNARWRQQCRRLRNMSPEKLGVPEEYIPPLKEAPKDLKQVRDGRTKTTPRSHSRTACSGGKPYNDTSQQNLPEDNDTRSASEIAPSTNLDDVGNSNLSKWGTSEFRRRHKYDCFWRTSQLLTKIGLCVVPNEMAFYFMAAMRMLHWEATLALTRSSKEAVVHLSLDADSMFPIVTCALVHAELPLMHTHLLLLRQFAVADNPSGEVSYFLTTVEAAASFIMDFSGFEEETDYIEEEADEDFKELQKLEACALDDTPHGKPVLLAAEDVDKRTDLEEWQLRLQQQQHQLEESRKGEDIAMRHLGTWLGAQEAMEDTINVLEQEGWF